MTKITKAQAAAIEFVVADAGVVYLPNENGDAMIAVPVTALAAALKGSAKDNPVLPATPEVPELKIIGSMISYMEDGKRRRSIAVNAGKRQGVAVVKLEDGTLIERETITKVGARLTGDVFNSEAKSDEKAEGGARQKTQKQKPVDAEERTDLKVSEVRGNKVELQYRWAGKVQTKQVQVQKVVKRDGERFAVSGDLSLEFDKIVEVGGKLVYKGRVSKADFEAI